MLGINRERLEELCTSVEQAGVIQNEYAMPYNNGPFFHCQGLKQPLKELWPNLRN